MTTNRTRRKRGARNIEIDPSLLAWFKDEAPAPVEHYFMTDEAVHGLWVTHGAEIVAEWAETAPGTRPAAWWKYDAPENRQRLGGKGTPASDVSANAPYFVLGVPADWAEDFDPTDPPMFESQAAFLKRHGLMLAGEFAWLNFQPCEFAVVAQN